MIIRRGHVGQLTAAIALTLSLSAALAGEATDAQSLYQTNCLKCHGDEVYTRADRKVTSLDGLERQVRRCETALGLRWFDEEISDVTAYLNDHFYKLER